MKKNQMPDMIPFDGLNWKRRAMQVFSVLIVMFYGSMLFVFPETVHATHLMLGMMITLAAGLIIGFEQVDIIRQKRLCEEDLRDRQTMHTSYDEGKF